MKNIIVAVDFSEVSVDAARYAVQLAKFCGATAWIYHTYQLPVTVSDIGYPFVSAAELKNLADFQMTELVKQLSEAEKDVLINSRVDINSVADGLQSFCDEMNADLLVMGISGKTAIRRFVVGSNTIHAIEHLHYPILIIPAVSAFLNYKKIGLSVDYEKPVSQDAINFIKAIQNTFGAELYIINIDWNNRHHTVAVKQQQDILQQQLDNKNVHFQVLQNEHIATAIHDFVRNESIELLITLPKKHNLVERLFSLPHTPELLYHTEIPVLCIPE
jgi:nucleotide-binding universal stress UspA family protein